MTAAISAALRGDEASRSIIEAIDQDVVARQVPALGRSHVERAKLLLEGRELLCRRASADDAALELVGRREQEALERRCPGAP